MNVLSALMVGVLSLATPHDEIADGTTVGEILNLAPVNATNAAKSVVVAYDATNLTPRISAKYAKPNGGIPMTDLAQAVQQTIYGKQDALVSGTNIRSINGQSLVGPGNMAITPSSIGAQTNGSYAAKSDIASLDAKIATKQTNLVSGVNIKTVNGNSLLGSGNIVIQGGGGTPSDYTTTNAVCNLITNNVAPWAMAGKSDPQGMTTNAVRSISSMQITNSVQSGYLCTVEAARGMTNGIKKVAWTGAYGDLSGKPTILPVVDNGNDNYSMYANLNARGTINIGLGDLTLEQGSKIAMGSSEISEVAGVYSFSNSSGDTSTLLPDGTAVLTRYNAYTKTEADDLFASHTEVSAITNRADSTSVFATNLLALAEATTTNKIDAVLDYALTNLMAGALSLRSGEIGNYATAGAAFALTLDFSAAANRSGDCLLYVANTGTADAAITLLPNTYTFVSADIAKARTLTKATTNIVSFTRVNATTVLVSKLEVK